MFNLSIIRSFDQSINRSVNWSDVCVVYGTKGPWVHRSGPQCLPGIVHQWGHPFIHLESVCYSSQSSINPFIYSQSLSHPVIYSFIPPLIYPFIGSYPSLHHFIVSHQSFIYLLIQSSSHATIHSSIIHSVIHSFIKSIRHL